MGLFKNKDDYIGVDIGSGGIRLVQLKPGSGGPTLVTYGHVATEPGLTMSDSPAAISKVAGILKQLVRDARVSAQYAVVGVPSSKVFATVITTPKLGEQELGRAIMLQAEQYIPISTKDAKVDWVVIGPGRTEQEQEVLLVAAPNTVTEKYLSIFEQSGMELMAVEPNAVALARAVVGPSDLAVMTLDIGSTTSDITIVHANMPKLLRSVHVGGTIFVKSVAQNLGLDDEQADQFTRKFGLTQSKLEGQVLKAIKPSLDQLVAEIMKSIQFFAGQNPDVKLEKIVLTGGTTALPELPTYLSTATGLPLEISNAWSKVNYPANLQDTLMSLSTEYGVAVGLAERDLLS